MLLYFVQPTSPGATAQQVATLLTPAVQRGALPAIASIDPMGGARQGWFALGFSDEAGEPAAVGSMLRAHVEPLGWTFEGLSTHVPAATGAPAGADEEETYGRTGAGALLLLSVVAGFFAYRQHRKGKLRGLLRGRRNYLPAPGASIPPMPASVAAQVRELPVPTRSALKQIPKPAGVAAVAPKAAVWWKP